MSLFRPILFWSHLVIGVACGLVVLVMAVTGVLLTYEHQMLDYANRNLRRAPPTANARPLPVATLVAKMADGVKGSPLTAVGFSADPEAPAWVAAGRRRTYVDPYTGDLLGDGPTRTAAFFRGVTRWHRWLGAEGRQTAGGHVAAAGNLAFLFLVLSGLVLWVPRRLTLAALRAVAVPRFRVGGRPRDWNWHHVLGVWCAVPLLIVVASGAVISYPWANRLLYRAVGDTPPAPQQGGGGPASRPATSGPAARFDVAALAGADEALAVAKSHEARWRTITLQLPRSADAPLAFTIDWGSGRQPQRRGTLTVSRGDVPGFEWKPFSAQSAGQRARAFARFGHTGEVGGVAGQTLAGVASAGACVLVWTGLALTARRAYRRTRRRK